MGGVVEAWSFFRGVAGWAGFTGSWLGFCLRIDTSMGGVLARARATLCCDAIFSAEQPP